VTGATPRAGFHRLFAAAGCGEQEKMAQAEQKMPDGRVRCELWEGFRAVRELQEDELGVLVPASM